MFISSYLIFDVLSLVTCVSMGQFLIKFITFYSIKKVCLVKPKAPRMPVIAFLTQGRYSLLNCMIMTFIYVKIIWIASRNSDLQTINKWNTGLDNSQSCKVMTQSIGGFSQKIFQNFDQSDLLIGLGGLDQFSNPYQNLEWTISIMFLSSFVYSCSVVS